MPASEFSQWACYDRDVPLLTTEVLDILFARLSFVIAQCHGNKDVDVDMFRVFKPPPPPKPPDVESFKADLRKYFGFKKKVKTQ
jgi:hypothetical protein